MNPLQRLPPELPPRCWLRGGTVAGHGRADLLLEGGRVAAIATNGSGTAETPAFDLDGAMVFPAFVDVHTHLDKGDLLAAGLAPERDLFAAIGLTRADYANWSDDELRRRADFALRTARAHGTRALLSYVDWPDAGSAPRAWPVLQDLREHWAGRVELVVSSLADIAVLADARAAERLARTLAELGEGQGVLGLFVYPGAPIEWLPRAFDLAERFALRLDFHIDENLLPEHTQLGRVARLCAERGQGARTVCGHACALSAMPLDAAEQVLDDVAASGLTLVSLPLTNLYLQDNALTSGGGRRTPRRRGLLPLHEARARGVPLAIGSDNHRDPFHPGGDLDLLATLAFTATTAQLDDAARAWIDTITTTPARALGLAWDGTLKPGAPADLVLHPGRHSAEVLSRPAPGRLVLRRGQPLPPGEATAPDWRELDGVRREPGR